MKLTVTHIFSQSIAFIEGHFFPLLGDGGGGGRAPQHAHWNSTAPIKTKSIPPGILRQYPFTKPPYNKGNRFNKCKSQQFKKLVALHSCINQILTMGEG